MDFIANTFAPMLNLPYDPIFRYHFIAVNVLSFLCWIVSVITQNFSIIDRIWPIEPCLFAWGFLFTSIYFNPALKSELNSKNYSIIRSSESSQLRLIAITLLVTIWCIRLTYNYWRKGGYKWTAEDYRWTYVQKFKIFDYPNKKILYNIFNFVFTFFQVYLLMGLVGSMWFIQTNVTNSLYKHQEPFNYLDGILVMSFLAFFLIEIVADQQQWNFQTRKYKWLDEKQKNKKSEFTSKEIEDFKRGFLIRGLFGFSRHPNFFAEISLWWVVYAFSISSQYSKLVSNFEVSLLFNYSLIGPLFLTLLFHGSTDLTEKISLTKYAKYVEYQARVSRLIPFLIIPSRSANKND